MKINRITNNVICRCGLLAGMMLALQVCLSSLPNIEVVSIILIAGTVVYGWEMVLAAEVFSILEILVWGFGLWNIMYLYIWMILVTITMIFRRVIIRHWWVSIVVCGLYGLSFGALCTIPYLIAGGFATGLAWWVSGLTFDIIHCIGNTVSAICLYKPLNEVMKRCKNV